MLKKALFICFLMVISIVQISFAAESFQLDHLNLGTFIPKGELVTREITIYLPAEDSLKGFKVWLGDSFSDGTNILTGERLRIWDQSKSNYHSISSRPVTISTSDMLQGKIPLVFTICAYPQDLPGIYETELHLSKIYEKEQGTLDSEENNIADNINIHLTQKIDKWVKMGFITDVIEIDYIMANSLEISNYNKPCIIEVNANTPWELYANLNKTVKAAKIAYQPKIKLESSNNYSVIHPGGVLLSEEPVLLATGLPVMEQRDVTRILLDLYLEDFTSVPAGRLSFPINFTIQPVQ